jgi:hypothetical protein
MTSRRRVAKGKRQNQLTQAHIDKIVGTYQSCDGEEGYRTFQFHNEAAGFRPI